MSFGEVHGAWGVYDPWFAQKEPDYDQEWVESWNYHHPDEAIDSIEEREVKTHVGRSQVQSDRRGR